MISAILLSSRAWRSVGFRRCALAVLAVVAFDLLSGVVASALLGMKAGKA